MPKNSAEYCPDYRKRENKIKKTPKSSTERVREFRARRKALLNVENGSSNTHIDDFTVQNNGMDTQGPTHVHFPGRCRTCLQELEEVMAEASTAELSTQEPQRKWLWIYDTVEECGAKQIAFLLRATIPKLKVQTDDTLSRKICQKCLKQLLTLFEFQQMCLESEKEMRKLLCDNEMNNAVTVVQEAQESNVLLVPPSLPELADVKPTIDPLQVNDNIANKSVEMQSFFKIEINDTEIREQFDEEIMLEDPKFINEAKVAENDETYLIPKDHTAASHHSSDSEMDNVPLENLKSKRKFLDVRTETLAANVEETIATDTVDQSIKSSFPCMQCKEVFDKQKCLEQHLKQHKIALTCQNNDLGTGVPSTNFICKRCSKNFRSLRGLTLHTHYSHGEKLLHNQHKQHICEYCNKKFQRAAALTLHLRSHTKEQPFLCSECGKGFESKGNLKIHLLRHSGIRSYECPVCPQKFTTAVGLTAHKAVHRVEKPHVCDQCGKAFSSADCLNRHKFCHTGKKPHKCEYCEMRFRRGNEKRRHMLTHTGEKPYKCKYCDRAFAQSGDLIKHLRSHLGENVYRCELCPGAFRKACDLRNHLPLHKNEDEETREKNLKALMEEGKRFGLNITRRQTQSESSPS